MTAPLTVAVLLTFSAAWANTAWNRDDGLPELWATAFALRAAPHTQCALGRGLVAVLLSGTGNSSLVSPDTSPVSVRAEYAERLQRQLAALSSVSESDADGSDSDTSHISKRQGSASREGLTPSQALAP
eukprot:Skav210177  [mRNA]  locus=scaffold5148:70474:70860:+ [translate_table: standard]